MNVAYRCADCLGAFEHRLSRGSGAKPKRCPTCAYVRANQVRGFVAPARTDREAPTCRVEGCAERCIPSARGPLPTVCPAHWRERNKLRHREWRAKRGMAVRVFSGGDGRASA